MTREEAAERIRAARERVGQARHVVVVWSTGVAAGRSRVAVGSLGGFVVGLIAAGRTLRMTVHPDERRD